VAGSNSAARTLQKQQRIKNAFFMFSLDARQRLQEQRPTLTGAALMRALSAEWRAMDAHLKAPYILRAMVQSQRDPSAAKKRARRLSKPKRGGCPLPADAPQVGTIPMRRRAPCSAVKEDGAAAFSDSAHLRGTATFNSSDLPPPPPLLPPLHRDRIDEVLSELDDSWLPDLAALLA
jgi:hypothetical protein